MILRKLWAGDLLNLAAGNSFYGRECVSHKAGTAFVASNAEEGHPLVEIVGGYTVKRSDLSELSDLQVRIATLSAEIKYAGLRGNSREDCARFAEELKSLLRARQPEGE